MDFGLSDEQLLLKETVRRFLAEQCPTSRVRAIMETETGHDAHLWGALAELGLTGLQVSEAHGGSGLELLDVALAAEELGYAATPGPFLAHTMAVAALRAGGDSAPASEWLPRLAAGTSIAATALGEPGGVWQPEDMTARVEGGRLSGVKSIVPGAVVADCLVVAAQAEDGPGLFVVARDAAGVDVQPLSVVDMTRRADSVRFSQAPASPIGDAVAVQRAFDAGCILIAADAYGGARRALDMAVDYAKQREQFGQIIGAFQAVKHQLADCATELEPALSLWWYAAHAYDHIQDHAERHAALAKAHLADVFDRVVRVSTEIHGGIGFTWEFDLQLWFRRSVFDRSYLGEARFHRARAATMAGW